MLHIAPRTDPTPEDGAKGEESLPVLYQLTFRRAYYLTGDRGVAEDLAQETVCRFLSRRPAGLKHPGAWLHTVCTRLCFDWMRERSRHRPEPLAKAETLADSATGPEQRLAEQEEQAEVRQALDRLEPRDRMILLMRYSSASYREIAAAVGCAESSVGQLLHRAERRFRAAYEHLAQHPSR